LEHLDKEQKQGDYFTLSTQNMQGTDRMVLGKFSQLIQILQSIVRQAASSLKQYYNVTASGFTGGHFAFPG
jgi:hypothetical protein